MTFISRYVDFVTKSAGYCCYVLCKKVIKILAMQKVLVEKNIFVIYVDAKPSKLTFFANKSRKFCTRGAPGQI